MLRVVPFIDNETCDVLTVNALIAPVKVFAVD